MARRGQEDALRARLAQVEGRCDEALARCDALEHEKDKLECRCNSLDAQVAGLTRDLERLRDATSHVAWGQR